MDILLTRVDRGDHEGFIQVLLSEEQSWEEAQNYAKQIILEYGMTVIRKIDGPDAWLWYVEYNGSTLIIGYDDYPSETVIFANTKNDEKTLKEFFEKMRK